MKNLDAAVVASKRPGYFKYHEPSEHVARLEKGGELSFLVERMRKVQSEIDAVRCLAVGAAAVCAHARRSGRRSTRTSPARRSA